MNERGNLAIDILLTAIIIFGITVVYVWTGKINTDITTPMIAQNLTGNQGTAMLQQQRTNFAPLWDNLGVLIFGLIWVFLLISSYYIQTNPVFFIVMFILMAGSIIVIMILGNTFDTLNQNPDFHTNAVQFQKLYWLNYHIVETIMVVIITCGIALYAKKDNAVPGGFP